MNAFESNELKSAQQRANKTLNTSTSVERQLSISVDGNLREEFIVYCWAGESGNRTIPLSARSTISFEDAITQILKNRERKLNELETQLKTLKATLETPEATVSETRES